MDLINENERTGDDSQQTAVLDGGPALPVRRLTDVLRATVASHPTMAALDDGVACLTYTELLARVEADAKRINELGVGAGQRVGIRLMSGNAELYIAILSVLFSGAAYVPVDVDDGDLRARTVFAQAGVVATIDEHGLRRVEGAIDDATADVPDDAWVIFTSGSTGTPKGVAVTHHSAAALVDAEAELFCRSAPLGPGDRVVAGLSVAFDASVEEMWLAWRSGACLVPFSREEMRSGPDLAALLASRRITAISTVPSLAAHLRDAVLPRLRLVILGGEACSSDLAGGLVGRDREVWNTYGPTETTVIATAALFGLDDPVTIGWPIRGTRVAVVDDQDRPVAPGEVGQLVITGAGLGRYLREPTTGQSGFRAVASLGWARAYFTGDFVELTSYGLRFAGRRDDQVKVAGRRIELGEVENAAASALGVRAACAVTRNDTTGVRLVCYIVGDAEYDEATLRDHLLQRLPAGVVPLIARLEALPLKGSGKVDRSALPWPVVSEALNDGPTDPETFFVSAAWRAVLGPVALSPSTNFFAVGGTSIAAAQLIVLLRERYPSCSVADVYQTPQLSDLTARLASRPTPTAQVHVSSSPRRNGARRQMAISVALQSLAALRWLAVVALINVVFHLGGFATTWSIPAFAATVLIFLTQPGRLLLAGLLVRLITFGIRPGTYPRAGSVHLRLWSAERVVSVMSVEDALGTPWITTYARVVGCAIGARVELHTMPPVTGLLGMGCDATVESGVVLGGWSLASESVRVGAISIGDGARIGARAVVSESITIGADAVVEMGAVVENAVPAGAYVAGSPARVVDAPPVDWTLDRASRQGSWSWVYRAGTVVLSAIPLISMAPALVLYMATGPGVRHTVQSLLWTLEWGPLVALLGVATYALLTVALMRASTHFARPGVHAIDSLAGFSSWMVERLVENSRHVLFPLYASVVTPWWLRRLGMGIGREVEVSTVAGQLHLVRVDSGAFLADDVLIAPREVWRGMVRLGEVHVGSRGFVGNSAIVRIGCDVPDDTLIGVASDAPRHAIAGAAYLGVPALEFPRQRAEADPRRTFAPTRGLRVARATIELLRIVPMVMAIVLAEVAFLLALRVANSVGLLATVAIVTVVLSAVSVAAMTLAVVAKWALIGRVRRGDHPLWSNFVWRNELSWSFVESLAVPWMEPAFLGTPVLNVFFRALGARIGRNVWCETWFLDDPDLVTIGDHSVVGRGSDLQTHLFHDRLLRLDHVIVGDAVTLGSATYVLLGARLGDRSLVDAGSLVPRNEEVPVQTSWHGNPIVTIDDEEQCIVPT
jgi:non-ribosomal peptide synthetase-like protein